MIKATIGTATAVTIFFRFVHVENTADAMTPNAAPHLPPPWRKMGAKMIYKFSEAAEREVRAGVRCRRSVRRYHRAGVGRDQAPEKGRTVPLAPMGAVCRGIQKPLSANRPHTPSDLSCRSASSSRIQLFGSRSSRRR